jgi:hypothetical protein
VRVDKSDVTPDVQRVKVEEVRVVAAAEVGVVVPRLAPVVAEVVVVEAEVAAEVVAPKAPSTVSSRTRSTTLRLLK